MSRVRKGRPYQIPEDRTSLRAALVDVDARVGWLLLMSRLHQGDDSLAQGGNFMTALADIGLQADRSAVSRWESGKIQPRFAVLTAYERVLQLRPGQLSSVVNALRRQYEPEGNRGWAPILDPRSEGFHMRLDYLLDTLLSDRVTGPDWTEFAYYAWAAQTLYLHGSVWRELTWRLVDQMARSVGLAYLQRFETVRILLGHRMAETWLLRAISEYLSDPAVQIVNDPVGVLEISTAPEAAAVLLERFVQSPSESVFEATMPGIAYKVAAQQYDRAGVERIEATVMRTIHSGPRDIAGLQEIIVAMPEASQNRLIEASRGLRGHQDLATIAAHGEWVRPDVAKRISQQIADQVTAGFDMAALYDEDPMTPRLIREALFSARSEHRHHSSLLLLASPFREPLAATLVEYIAAANWKDPTVPRFLRLLRYLAGPAQEPALLSWVPRAEDPVIRDMVRAIGHLPSSGADLSPLVQRLADDGSMSDRAIMYGLGMRQDPSLTMLASSPDHSDTIRSAASWWLHVGGSIRE